MRGCIHEFRRMGLYSHIPLLHFRTTRLHRSPDRSGQGRLTSMACVQRPQVHVPPELPEILKQFTKAAIKAQPPDVLAWSAAWVHPIRPFLDNTNLLLKSWNISLIDTGLNFNSVCSSFRMMICDRMFWKRSVGLNTERTEKDRKGPKRTEKDQKGTEKDRKGTEKDWKGRTSLLFTEKEAKSRR